MPERSERTPETAINERENFITTPEILDGAEAKDLLSAAREYKFKSGEIVVAGTDIGVTPRTSTNEDRVVIIPEENFVAVIDGVGGRAEGEVAAQILAENFVRLPKNPDQAAHLAVDEFKAKNVSFGAGAVFVTTHLRQEGGQKFIDVAQAGDCRVIIVSKNGEVKFQSEDETAVQALVLNKIITPDKALYHNRRNVVINAVQEEKDFEVRMYDPIFVENGDRVISMSDGVSDNLTAEEIAGLGMNKSPRELFDLISHTLQKRMTDMNEIKNGSNREADGKYSDNFKSEPKVDNRALAIFEIV